MELTTYLKIIKKNFDIITYTTFIVVGLALTITFLLPETYRGDFSLFIVKDRIQQTEDYKYDQFYAVKTQEKIGEFIEQYLQNPQTSSAILKQAGVENIDYSSRRALRNAIRVTPVSAQEVKITLKLKQKEKIEKTADIVYQNTAQKIKSLYPADNETQYTVEKSTTLVTTGGPSLKINLIIAAIAGIFSGVLATFFRHYLAEIKTFN